MDETCFLISLVLFIILYEVALACSRLSDSGEERKKLERAKKKKRVGLGMEGRGLGRGRRKEKEKEL